MTDEATNRLNERTNDLIKKHTSQMVGADDTRRMLREERSPDRLHLFSYGSSRVEADGQAFIGEDGHSGACWCRRAWSEEQTVTYDGRFYWAHLNVVIIGGTTITRKAWHDFQDWVDNTTEEYFQAGKKLREVWNRIDERRKELGYPSERFTWDEVAELARCDD